jgi:NADH-quinone oxidoreductase subunit J
MFEMIIFGIFALIAVVASIVVVTHRNPVVSALSLVGAFFALAVMYVLLDAPFLAALQVIVYAGAIMVLFLFVIMLLNLQGTKEEKTRPIQQFLGYTGSAAFALTLAFYLSKAAVVTALPRFFPSDVRSLGFTLFDRYVLPFEFVSILLLAAIVGALVLSQRGGNNAPQVPREEAK